MVALEGAGLEEVRVNFQMQDALDEGPLMFCIPSSTISCML
jgi:hypothetical protein